MQKTLKISLSLSLAWCAAMVHGQSVFTCIDAKGHKIVADRPIAQCADRTQKEMTSSGTVKRVMGPTLTAQEQLARDEKEREQAQQQARQAEERRLDHALLLRYPRQALHDRARVTALAQIDEVIKVASQRSMELARQRKQLDAELVRYAQDPSETPVALKRRSDENQTHTDIQKRFIAGQKAEKERTNARFDEALTRLKNLWPATGTATSVEVPPAPAAPLPTQVPPQTTPVR